MNAFKQKRAVAECKAMRKTGKCPRACMHWNRGRGAPFCSDSYSAERRQNG